MFVTKKNQGAFTTFLFYSNYTSKRYGRGLSNSTIVGPKKPITHKREIRRVVRLELQKLPITFEGVYTTFEESRVARSYCLAFDLAQFVLQNGGRAITKDERDT